MVDLTILEIHLPEAQFNAPFAGESGTGDEAGEPAETGSGGSGGVIAVLLITLSLAALAWFLRQRGSDEDAESGVDLEAEVHS